jgi:hypothetical protein
VARCVLIQRNPRNMLIHLQTRHQAVAELLVADFTYRLAACVDGATIRSFAAIIDANLVHLWVVACVFIAYDTMKFIVVDT